MTADLYTHTFTWSGEGDHVVATGTFDNWTSSLALTKGEDGKFTGSKELAYGEKISYKYVVDGTWKHNPDEPHESDASGNVNNTFQVPDKAADTTLVPLAEADSTAIAEKPAEPAPTPAVPATTSVPTVPSDADIVNGVGADAKVEEEVPEETPKDDTPVIAAASAGVGALLAGAAVVATKAFEAAGSVVEQSKEALGYSSETPAAEIAKDAADTTTQKVQESAESAKTQAAELVNSSSVGQTSFAASTMAALGLTGAAASSADGIPAPDKASTTLPASEAPVASTPSESATEAPNKTITPIPVSKAPAASALTTANGSAAAEPKPEEVKPVTTSEAVSSVPVDAAPAAATVAAVEVPPATPAKENELPKPPPIPADSTAAGIVKDKKKSSIGGAKREPSTAAQDGKDTARARKPSIFQRLKHTFGGK